MPDWATRFIDECWAILLDAGVWLIVGFALAGVVHALVPIAWVRRQLGGRGIAPIAKAAALGLPLPLCSCSVIPVAASLRGAGAGRGASAAFTISTPQTGEESIPLTWALFGPVFALARPVIAIATAFAAGVAIDRIAPDGASADGPTDEPADQADTKPADAGGCCCAPKPAAPACCGSTPPPEMTPKPAPRPAPKSALGPRLIGALRYGFVTLPADLAVWLTVGLALAAAVAAFAPADWIGEHLGSGVVPMLAALVVGVPLYICSTSSTPLAFALVVAGMSPGAALVLLLAGPATNTATMAWVLKDLGGRALAVYLVTIAAFALGSGLAFDAFFAHMLTLGSGTHEHTGAGALTIAGAVALAAVLTLGLVVKFKPQRARTDAASEPASEPAPRADRAGA